MHWQNNSPTYLYGKDHKIDPPIRQTLTFEHASGWRVGDPFFFVDGIMYNGQACKGAGDGHTFYGDGILEGTDQNTASLLVNVHF